MSIGYSGGNTSSTTVRVLLFEDNPGDVELVRTYLETVDQYEIEFEYADAFEEGLAKIDAFDPDVLLLDLNLRDTGARETIRRVEECPDSLPVVVLTGASGQDDLELQALKRGADEFLEKGQLGPELLNKHIEHALERQRRRRELRIIQRAVDAAREGVVVADARKEDEPLIYCNEGFLEITGYDEDEVLGRNCRFLQIEETNRGTVSRIREAVDRADPITVEMLNERKSGERFWNELSIAPVTDEDGELTHFVGFQRDVTRRVETEQKLRDRTRELEQYQRIIEHTTDAIMLKDREGRYQLVNSAMAELLGSPKEEIRGATAHDFFDEEKGEAFESRNREVLEQGQSRTCEEMFPVHDEDGEHTFLTTYLPYRKNQEIEGTIVIARDITERKQMRDQLERQALYDSLTDLPNRTLFRDRLEQAAERARRREETFAIAYVDLDGFKAVNDSFGHPAGDKMLRNVANRLCSAVRDEDTVARVGGDEFMVLLEGLQGRFGLERVGERCEAAFDHPFPLNDSEVHQSASIGIAYPDETIEVGNGTRWIEQLTRTADHAMYESKETTGTTWQIFDLSNRGSNVGRIQRENRIREAIKKEEFTPHYQPIYRLADDRIAAVEVLARWRSPDRGFVSPGTFIPLAEKSSLICDLGEEILEQACRDFAERASTIRRDGPFKLFVNLSPRQVERKESVRTLVEIVEREAPPDIDVHFEVTETELLEHAEHVQLLRDEGYGILVDDFGTGHSSLNRFKKMPVDGLKLDMEFIHGMLESPVDAAIVETIVDLGLKLEIPVIAEGIETRDQLEALREIGCAAAQGYYMARPQPFEKLLETMAE